ncbi:GlxA family transcriptional regulator [Marinicella litoralis]|uniref:Transcriptional regulator GlxA family with amidase domain n=1 Tax=Marinicella litoralis TaxID=644220 RepID=A0A4R6XQV7_9GAMM|nr:helix-turn-helix domain-containing protein [Marinicella litoralis]TDR20364.1 transcriptional regulator GlxA family with amidase domain [Marinicella litoralis]
MTEIRDHNIAFLGFDQIELMDLIGPLEAYNNANRVLETNHYNTFIVSEHDNFVSESHLKISSDYLLGEEPEINTLVIPGGRGARIPEIIKPYQQWFDNNYQTIDRIVAVCTGLFMIAEHPFLMDKEVVTHWSFVDRLKIQHPHLKVCPDRLFIQQDNFYSVAGILSGIDLALHLIEEDCGVDVATFVAKDLITYLKRSGHESQFSEPLKFQSTNNTHIDRINRWLMGHYSEHTTVNELASKVHVSERHLNRLIKTHFHMSASKYIEHIKLEQAKIYLAKKDTAVDTAASMVGYASADVFRRSFKRKYGMAPHTYQLRFQ